VLGALSEKAVDVVELIVIVTTYEVATFDHSLIGVYY
jgi:hypothetical protein